MGDVLAGSHAAWEFETDTDAGSRSVLIRYERGLRTPKLFAALGERRVPLAAVADVTLEEGRRGSVVLRLVPRPGADPLTEAAAGQLKESCDPYRLTLPPDAESLARRCADELRAALPASGPAERFLVDAPEVPLSFKAYDAKASFDGRTVRFRWFWTGASSAKWKAGDQRFAVSDLCGVEWRSPEAAEGHLRLLPRDAPADGDPAPTDRDPASVVFGPGYGAVHESLPFAAAVLAAVRPRSAVTAAAAGSGVGAVTAVPAPRPDPAEVAARIRHLGELRGAGLVTDAEFSAKKAELLSEL
ncbi:DUF4429 domain-containing protein [Streptomyces sp. NPDC091281]|uniref:DUF4429 domain-containing protein n=1 Tax=Streptomyces sp. NPDC091281 TaxID=3365985 RepID=UPI00381ECD94